MSFTQVVRMKMAQIGMSSSELARRSGYSQQYISDLLAGRRRWNETTIDRVCEILDIKVQFTIPVTSEHGEPLPPTEVRQAR